jgi:predicted RNase H-like nuclease
MAVSRFFGADLAWSEGRDGRSPNESGVAVLDLAGRVLDVGWTRGIAETAEWIESRAGTESALLFVDAPLVVSNATGQRFCETQVGQRYGRWKVSANTTNKCSSRLAGMALRRRLEDAGWCYSDGFAGPPTDGQVSSECYPYTTLVGAVELGYDVERPRYKRKPRSLPTAEWRPMRAVNCDELIRRLVRLEKADPPLLLGSHPITQELVEEPSPIDDELLYKHREDLIDALLCAWTATLWARHGLTRCQVLGQQDSGPSGPYATIVAPARPEQRR